MKMLSSGKKNASPNNGMWPLLCNEVGLSYDQEERIRSLQRELISQPESWLNRHTSAASQYMLDSLHEAVNRLAASAKARQKKLIEILTPTQQAKYLTWLSNNTTRLSQNRTSILLNTEYEGTSRGTHKISPDNHVAANLYVINDKLKTISKIFDIDIENYASHMDLRKFSRRPAFESLANIDEPAVAKKRKSSADFSGGMKRSSSDVSCLTMDLSEGNQGFMKKSASGHSLSSSGLTPESAQIAASSYILEALSAFQSIIPNHSLRNNSSDPISLPAGHFVGGKPTSVQFKPASTTAAPSEVIDTSQVAYTQYLASVPECVQSSSNITRVNHNFDTNPSIPLPTSLLDPAPLEQYTSYQRDHQQQHQNVYTPYVNTKLKSSASAPVFGAAQNIDDDLTNDVLAFFLPSGDGDDGMFDLDEDFDWAIGEGNVLDF